MFVEAEAEHDHWQVSGIQELKGFTGWKFSGENLKTPLFFLLQALPADNCLETLASVDI